MTYGRDKRPPLRKQAEIGMDVIHDSYVLSRTGDSVLAPTELGDVIISASLLSIMYTGSLTRQALLNKRLGRCAGPPFLRLLDAMRFLEQMLSAVGHLLEHGLAHNDIKPGMWVR